MELKVADSDWIGSLSLFFNPELDGSTLGAKYNVTENWAVSAGGKYLWFGDAKGRLPSGKIVGDFQDNDGFIAGVKLSYQAR